MKALVDFINPALPEDAHMTKAIKKERDDGDSPRLGGYCCHGEIAHACSPLLCPPRYLTYKPGIDEDAEMDIIPDGESRYQPHQPLIPL